MGISDKLLSELISAAREAAKNAYTPYSRFPVGAAVLTENNKIFTGSNVENASYGLTMCAERNAILSAVNTGETKIKVLLVYTPTKEPTNPCGACRQVLYEFGQEAEVIIVNNKNKLQRSKLMALLPDSFGPENLHKNK